LRAVILASGRGERLAPLTNRQPKPLLPAANQPLLSYLLHALSAAGFTEVLVTLGYLGDQVKAFLATVSVGLSIETVAAPDWPRGPLGSLQAVVPLLKDESAFALLPADLYIDAESLRRLGSAEADDWALLYDPNQERPGPGLELDANHRATRLLLSTASGPARLPIVPVLRATPRLFETKQHAGARQASTVFELLQLWVSLGHPLQGIPIAPTFWIDIDGPADLLHLNDYILTTGWPPTPLPPGTYLPPGAAIEGPQRNAHFNLGVGSHVLGPALLGPGVHVGKRCCITGGTSLGADTALSDNVVLDRSITLPHTRVPPNAEVHNAILDAYGNTAR
jgi:NDP-sugar pyrophosphorylase family protein